MDKMICKFDTQKEEIVEVINKIIDKINFMELELTRIHRDRPHPRDVNPYDLNRYPRKKRK